MSKSLTKRELIEWMPDAATDLALSAWERSFAASIVHKTKDRPKWRPSKKQTVVMRRIVTTIQEATDADRFDLFEHTGLTGHINTEAA